MGLCKSEFLSFVDFFFVGDFFPHTKATVLICSGVDSKVVLYKESFAQCYQLPLTLYLKTSCPVEAVSFIIISYFTPNLLLFAEQHISHTLCCL